MNRTNLVCHSKNSKEAGFITEGGVFLFMPVSYDPETETYSVCPIISDVETGQMYFINQNGELDCESYMDYYLMPTPYIIFITIF